MTDAWKEPERRLTGIVLPSFDDPRDQEHLDEFELDRRARAGAAVDSGAPVPVVPAGPPPAWPPPEAEPAATQPRREFPRFIHGEFVLPPEGAPAPATAGFDPLTAPVDVLESRLHPSAAPEGLRNALPTWALPSSPGPEAAPTGQWERIPAVEIPEEPAATEPVTAPPAAAPRLPTTAAPLPTTAAPRPATAPPWPTTAAPGPTTAAPRPATAPPWPTTAAPLPTTAAPGPATAPLWPAAAPPVPTTPPPPLPLRAPPAAALPSPVAGPPPVTEPAWEPVAEAPSARTARLPLVDEPTAPVPVVPPVPSALEPIVAAEAAVAVTPTPRRGPGEGAPHPAFPDATARTFRILPIAADLLPLEISETRHVRRVRRLVIVAVVLVAALVVGWYGMTVHEHTQAQNDRQAILDTSQDLLRQRHKQYDELTRIQSDSGQIDERLSKVLAYDLSWSKLLTALRDTATAKNAKLSGITAALSQEALAGKTEGDVVGTVTLTGTAPTKAAVAAYVDALTGVSGVANPFPSDATQEDDGVSFTIRVDVTKAALGGRFTSAAPSASPSGSK